MENCLEKNLHESPKIRLIFYTKDMSDDEVSRPVAKWRLINLCKLLALLHQDEKLARTTLANAIARSNNQVRTTDVSKTTASYAEHLGRILSTSVPFGSKWLSLVENGVQWLVSNGTTIPEYYIQDGFLDMPPQKDTVAYVLAAVPVGAWGAVYSELKDVPEIKEGALVFGGEYIDAIIKIESTIEGINEILLKKISSNRNIFRTQTLHVVPYSHWQKDQHMRLAEPGSLPQVHRAEYEKEYDESYVKSGFEAEYSVLPFDNRDDYYSEKIREMYEQEWRDKSDDLNRILKEGHIRVKSQAKLYKFPEIIVDAARQEIMAVVVWTDISKDEEKRTERYIKAQHNRLQRDKASRKFRIRRVFVIQQVSDLSNDTNLCVRVGQELDIGIEVRFIEVDNWPKCRIDDKPRDFGVMDRFATWIVHSKRNNEGIRQVDFYVKKNGRNEVQKAVDDFNLIWDDARELDIDLANLCRQSFKNS